MQLIEAMTRDGTNARQHSCRVTLARPRASADVSLGEADKLVHEFIPKGGRAARLRSVD